MTFHHWNSGPIPSPQSIELGQHLAQVLGMLPPEIHLLHLATSAPYSALSRRPVDGGVLVQHLILCRDDEDACADDTVGGHAEGMVDACAGADGVAVADGGGLDA